MSTRIDEADDQERAMARLALGRLFRILSSPPRPGDGDDYMVCRSIIMDTAGDVPGDRIYERPEGAAGD